ncbi:hypothetical protein [Paraburkholderia sp. 22B1P]|uniref:hypothetical protein n=1 Tax=Paraburkholderia sp. 22B1P TaxID=3080498 RepID=UPI00308BE984|nr:hypothetical protein PBP221_77180 [Paraburkholderia sp. 22B1P]
MNTNPSSTALGKAEDVSEVVYGDDENPLQRNILRVPDLREAMRLTEAKRKFDTRNWSKHEFVMHGAENGFVTDATRAGALIDIVASVQSNYGTRDLRDARYRQYAITAINLMHKRPRQSRMMIPSRSGIAPYARPRGLIVAAPVSMGCRRFADMIVDALDDEPKSARVLTPHGMAEYLQLPVLRAQWPVDGKLPNLAQEIIGAVDTAFDTGYAITARAPMFRERDIVPALCSLVAAFNVGLLVIERINTQGVTPGAADSCWEALAHITRATGVTILCLATPGAAFSSIARLPGALGAFTTTGITEIKRCQSPRDPYWIAICRSLFDGTVRIAGAEAMPDWFPGAAFELTLGYPSLLSKALTALALQMLTVQSKAFNAEIFLKYGGQALTLYAPHVNVLKGYFSKVRYKDSTLLRHSDWLPLNEVARLHLVPELA